MSANYSSVIFLTDLTCSNSSLEHLLKMNAKNFILRYSNIKKLLIRKLEITNLEEY